MRSSLSPLAQSTSALGSAGGLPHPSLLAAAAASGSALTSSSSSSSGTNSAGGRGGQTTFPTFGVSSASAAQNGFTGASGLDHRRASMAASSIYNSTPGAADASSSSAASPYAALAAATSTANASLLGRAASIAFPGGISSALPGSGMTRASFSAGTGIGGAGSSSLTPSASAAELLLGLQQPHASDSRRGSTFGGADTADAATAYLLATRGSISGASSGLRSEVPVSSAMGGPLSTSDPRTQLFVGNLPYRVRWQDLKDLFRRSGTVLRADVALTPENRSKGHGTVLLATEDDARRAAEMFNGFTWQGRVLEVRIDRSGTLLGGGYAGGGGGGGGAQQAPQFLGGGAAALDGMSGSRTLDGISPSQSVANMQHLASAPFGSSLGGADALNAASAPAYGGPAGVNPALLPFLAANGLSSQNGSSQGGANSRVSPSFSGGFGASGGAESTPAPTPYYGRVLFVGNLPFQCQWQDLKDLFRAAGDIQRADVALGPEGRSRGFGTVLFATPEDAQNAVRLYHG